MSRVSPPTWSGWTQAGGADRIRQHGLERQQVPAIRLLASWLNPQNLGWRSAPVGA